MTTTVRYNLVKCFLENLFLCEINCCIEMKFQGSLFLPLRKTTLIPFALSVLGSTVSNGKFFT